jgi:hypothetical protein
VKQIPANIDARMAMVAMDWLDMAVLRPTLVIPASLASGAGARADHSIRC